MGHWFESNRRHHNPFNYTLMKHTTKPKKSEKCAVCFFVNGKVFVNLVKTKDEKFNKKLMEHTFYPEG